MRARNDIPLPRATVLRPGPTARPRRRAIAALALVSALGLLVAGCGDVTPAADDLGSRDVDGLPVSVRVTYPGYGADMEPLRYDIDDGESATWEMQVDLDAEVDGTPSGLPPFTLRFDTDTERDGKDQFTVKVTVVDVIVGDRESDSSVEADTGTDTGTETGTESGTESGTETDGDAAGLSEAEQKLDKWIAPMRNLAGDLVLSNDGTLVSSTLELPRKLMPALKTVFAPFADGSILVAPLPAEPVGLGAQWVASNTIVLRDTGIDQQVTYTLLTHEDDEFEILVRATQGIEIAGDDGPSAGVAKIKGTITGSFSELTGRTFVSTQKSTTSVRRDDDVLTTVDIDTDSDVSSSPR